MKVLVLHTLPPPRFPPGRQRDEFDLSEAAEHVATALEHGTVAGVRGDPREIMGAIEGHRPDVVFNLCEAPGGRPDREAHAAALLEWLGIPFTGCGSETLSLCRRKERVNAILAAAGVRVPAPVDPGRPTFPCIVKPAAEDGSAGIDRQSVCDDETGLTRARARLGSPCVVQEFLPGREFAVSLWGRSAPDFWSVGETLFAHGLRLNTYAAKWDVDSVDFRDSPMTYTSDIAPSLHAAIVAVAQRTWWAVGARHALRIDLRLDVAGTPVVLDVNPNPEMSPDVGLCRATAEAGWAWSTFVSSLVAWA